MPFTYIWWACTVHIGLAWSQTIKTNVIGTLNMLGLAKRVGARLVIIYLDSELSQNFILQVVYADP